VSDHRLSSPGKASLFVLQLVGMLPIQVVMLIGSVLGWLMSVFWKQRREVCMRNLALCFPENTAAENLALMRKNFRVVGRAVMGHFVVLTASRSRIKRIVRVEGIHHLAGQSSHPTILFCPHFAGGIMLSVWATLDFETGMLYAPQHNALSDEVLRRVRRRFGGRLFRRKEDLMKACRWLKSGKILSLSPDADLNSEGGVAFVPFFAVEKTATTLAMSRLANMTGASVLPAKVTVSGAGRYTITFYPKWSAYPSGDDEKDAERMNQFLEQMILESPEQYFWIHRRFKTRPEGEPPLY